MEHSLRILLIEDNPVTQDTIKNTLELALPNIQVTVAGSGAEAFKVLEKPNLPSMIILDIKLPDSNGGAILETLADHPQWARIPVFPYTSLWNDGPDEPFDASLKIIREWRDAVQSSKLANMSVHPEVGKYRGMEGVKVLHPKLIIFIANILLHEKLEMTPSFELMLDSALRILTR